MKTDEKISLLKTVDLLNFFDHSTLTKLTQNCREHSLEAGETLFSEGSIENAMYLILSGELVIIKGNKQIATLGPGFYLGEMSLIESKPRSASAKATQKTDLLEISEEHFNEYLASEPKALLSMMRTLSSRIRNDLDNAVKEMQKLSIFTHDIKNNMTPLGIAELGLEDLIEFLEGQNGQHSRKGLDEAKECFEVITAVREGVMSMLEASLNQVKKIKAPYVKEDSDLIEVIRDTVQGISCHKNLRGKTIHTDGELNELRCKINALDIKRVLQNLIINAGCVTEDNGEIRIAIGKKDNEIQVSIIDQGGGIPEEIQPFLLKESLTTKKDGNGLGLLSCKNIVQDSHQGKFWYDTEIGKGTVFHFTLPICPD
ncbi:MAG: cyclic nucleotide-binding domain-containing protein [Candidatus Nitrohelix vancouverensis]|uniref:histidine kinase n=1 Tax=Candidatus Nitrohelix vancouverensis TaxID=2705534 RepID=A0A7T0C4R5_9BACT|nr:MAG: cyclic nucleotide-binding domain-containing protein [Candidatus Nitrohelix vancouverensis]